eukprot:CAMPEP_0115026834 /NCGR_PEP_ID=MMETSP0216-20121206/35036_1 /TAXON_ID=223996 /ORGANISM="Protocruzia adherens, Strain Boccale" /LENGTH=509 /DNA_ID=CAMNT_0002402093 /DNA_START=82 /DNA_END=1611 /DNA_ORIENTATION=-
MSTIADENADAGRYIVKEEGEDHQQWKLSICANWTPLNKLYTFNKKSTARKVEVKRAIKANPDVKFGVNEDIDTYLDAFHGELLFSMSPAVKTAVKEAFDDIAEDRQWKYVEEDGSLYAKAHPKCLRTLVAERLFHILENPVPGVPGIKVHPDEVLVYPYSSTAVLEKVMVSMSKTNGVVLAGEGFYKNNALLAFNAGLDIVPIPVNLEKDGKMDLDVMEETVAKYHRQGVLAGFLFTIPGNPLVVEYTLEELTRIGQILVRYNVPAVVDSIFFGAVPDGKCIQLAALEVEVDGKKHRMYDHIITCTGNSKSCLASGPTKFGALCTGNKAWREKLKHLMANLLFQRETTHMAKQTLMQSSPEIFADNRDFMINMQVKAKEHIALINEKHGAGTIKIMGPSTYSMFLVMSFDPELLKSAEINDNWVLEDFLLVCGGLDTVSFAYFGSKQLAVRVNVLGPRKSGLKSAEHSAEIFHRLDGVITFIKNGGTYSQALKRLNLEQGVSLEQIMC